MTEQEDEMTEQKDMTAFDFMASPQFRQHLFRHNHTLATWVVSYIQAKTSKSEGSGSIGIDGVTRHFRKHVSKQLTRKEITKVINRLEKCGLIRIDSDNFIWLQPEKTRYKVNKVNKVNKGEKVNKESKPAKKLVSKKSSTKASSKPATEADASLPALHLAGLFVDHNCRTYSNKNPSDFNKSKWAREIDTLSRLSGSPIPDIQKVVEWAWNDSFWASNVMAPSSLNKTKDGVRRLDTLRAKMDMHKKPANKSQRDEPESFQQWRDDMEEWFQKNGG